MSTQPLVNRLTPVIFVDQIEPCLGFWIDRLGFEKVAEVPGPDGKPQFAMLVRDGIEVMYQTWAALEAEVAGTSRAPRGHAVLLFIEVTDIEQVDRALGGIPRVAERHKTFYGMDEFSVREPSGAIVTFAMKVPTK
jgi:catechol 2,3-dioxygenase-like lactoylglutathione lyase family enzyme